MAMTFFVVREFYLLRQSEYFASYAKLYTDLPFAVVLKQRGDAYVSDPFLRARELGRRVSNPEWKTVYFDSRSLSFVVPNGSVGFRWDEDGHWNLNPEDSISGSNVDPLLTYAESNDGWVSIDLPFFDFLGARTRKGAVPVKKILSDSGEILVTTVFDLLAAHLGIDRGHGGDVAAGYDDPLPYTPAWQAQITGVPRAHCVRVAREFADNAEKTKGKSTILLGSGANHWYHSDQIYRSILNLTALCGCQGVSRGGWAHLFRVVSFGSPVH